MAYTTINKSTDYFNTKLYTGNGGTQTITGVGFQSDFTWFKSRSAANSHSLFDSVRGLGYALSSNLTGAQIPVATQTFNSDGYVLANDGGAPSVNPNGVTTVAWNWKANGAGSSNTDGTITSTVSANTTAGFSIVSYTGTGSSGATIGHGLGVAPNMIIARRKDGVEDWAVYHKTLGATKYLHINNDAAEQTNSNRWNNTTPSATLITLGNHASINYNGGTHIAYCFAEKTGYSKFGSYTGNDSTDGPFIYTGFKPAFILGKRTTNAGGWWMLDSKRPEINVTDEYLLSDSSQAEADDGSFATDFLSNGFKVRASNGNFNTAGNEYIYMAFAEAPLVGTNGVTAKAR